MLQINVIRENVDKILTGLSKRNFKDAEDLIHQVVETDSLRKGTQKKADDLKGKSNIDSKKIGELIRAGKNEDVNVLKGAVAADKLQIKVLEEGLVVLENRLQELLYKIPNVPAEKVPAGKGAEDNLNVYQYGAMPSLPPDAQPHWDLIKSGKQKSHTRRLKL